MHTGSRAAPMDVDDQDEEDDAENVEDEEERVASYLRQTYQMYMDKIPNFFNVSIQSHT